MEPHNITTKHATNTQPQLEKSNHLLTFPNELTLGKVNKNLNIDSYPIYFRHKEIGDIRLKDIKSLHPEPELLKDLVTQINNLLTFPLYSNYIAFESQALLSCSVHLRRLNCFINEAAHVNTPVVIEGDYGCDKLAVAHAIYSQSKLKNQPFIEITCEKLPFEEFQQLIVQGCKSAQNGYLFINDVDQLTLEQQHFLNELLSLGLRVEGGTRQYINMNNVRVFAASSCPLKDLVQQNYFSRQLYSKLNYLHIYLPPLQERKEDIPFLARQYLHKNSNGRQKYLSDQALKTLKQYDWPENDKQLEKVLARLICRSTKPEISFSDIQHHTPELLLTLTNSVHFLAKSKSLKNAPDKIVKILLHKEYNQLESLHSGLQKSLIHLAEHYCEELTLKILSEKGFISPSHLSFLFKSSLNLCFKPLLARLRIEKARKMLELSPQSRITDISLEVGFGDLSHFEKLFKRLTNMTPREYKNICKSNC